MDNLLTIRALIREHGCTGLSIWAYARVLLDASGGSASVNELVAAVSADLSVKTEEVQVILNADSLFSMDTDGKVYEHGRLSSRCSPEVRERRAAAGRRGAAKRWQGRESQNDDLPFFKEDNNLPTPPLAEKKNDNPEDDKQFMSVWEAYGKKAQRLVAFKAWRNLSKKDKAKVVEHVPYFVEATPEVQYRPYLSTYLHQGRYNEPVMTKQGEVIYDTAPQVIETKTRTYFGGLTPQ